VDVLAVDPGVLLTGDGGAYAVVLPVTDGDGVEEQLPPGGEQPRGVGGEVAPALGFE
jgi:hypothetical protein